MTADDLEAARTAARQRVADLQAEHEQITASQEGVNLDDEHDPEGATVAFEREQVRALLSQAQVRLGELEEALARASQGRYGSCETCGQPIGEGRLAALPGVATCISCAAGRPRR